MHDASEYIILLIASMVISIAVGIYAFRKADGSAVRFFAILTVFQALWTVGNLFEIFSSSLTQKLFWDNFQWIPTAVMPPMLLAFALRFTGRRLRREKLYWILIVIISVLFVISAWMDPWLGLMRHSIVLKSHNGITELTYGFTPMHHVANIFVVGVAVWGLGIIFQYLLRAPKLYQTQIAVILFGAASPFLAAMIAVLDLDFGYQRDMMPISFIALNLCIAWGLLGFRLFDVVPLAREMIIENLTDPITVLDAEDRVVDLNPALRRLLQVTIKKDPIGHSAWEVFAHWPDLLERFRGDGAPDGDLSIREGDQTLWFNIRVMQLSSRRGRPLGRLVIARNITAEKTSELELRQHRDDLETLVQARTAELAATNQRLRNEMAEREKIEERMRQGQKMEALGRLAGGVAHDLNNMLVPILNYTQLVLTGMDSTNPNHAQLTQVLRAAERAADLARQILAFSRRQVLQLAPLDLNRIVKEDEGILRRLIGADIRINVHCLDKSALVLADRSQLDQILFNLVVNARDAMPNGGELTIRVGEATLSEGELPDDWAIGPPAPGKHFTLEVSDTGTGMDATTRAQMFEPFFTTKEEGKGTGLGLSTVFGIVKQHGAVLKVRSEPYCGSTFQIFFPPTQRAVEQPAAVSNHESPTDTVSRVLVVDDEATVRSIATRILRMRGYNVFEAASPEEACKFAENLSEPIQLLVTDLVMPGMNGRALADHIRAIRPDIKVLFVSGYSDSEMADRGLLDGNEHYLAKPFTVDSLSKKVREVLQSE